MIGVIAAVFGVCVVVFDVFTLVFDGSCVFFWLFMRTEEQKELEDPAAGGERPRRDWCRFAPIPAFRVSRLLEALLMVSRPCPAVAIPPSKSSRVAVRSPAREFSGGTQRPCRLHQITCVNSFET